jgi:hypothetical protein
MTQSDGQYAAIIEVVETCIRERVHDFQGVNRFVVGAGCN